MSVTTERSALDELCINTIRTLSMDAVQKANSGHPGTPMALAPVAYLLYTRVMRHSPEHPDWPARDRFVLSAGHASMLLYSILHLTGYGVSLDDLKNFRQLGSPCAGHPEYGHAPGIETTTGPLGQGISTSVGMALGERMLAARFGEDLVGHHTYVIASDGDLEEGIASEASSLAGHLAPRPADRLLRRQPHLDRGRHRARVLRGRRQALRGLRLARAEPRRGHLARLDAGGDRRRPRRDRQAEHDHPAHAHRAGLAEQAGHARARTARRSARRRSGSPKRSTTGRARSRSSSRTRRSSTSARRSSAGREQYGEWEQAASADGRLQELERVLTRKLPGGWDSRRAEEGPGRRA